MVGRAEGIGRDGLEALPALHRTRCRAAFDEAADTIGEELGMNSRSRWSASMQSHGSGDGADSDLQGGPSGMRSATNEAMARSVSVMGTRRRRPERVVGLDPAR